LIINVRLQVFGSISADWHRLPSLLQKQVLFYIACFAYCIMEKKDIQKETLKPINKIESKEDKELQELEVESSGGGQGAGGG
jgi:hypothetical protein